MTQYWVVGGEYEVHKDYSATLRRVFSRRRQVIPFMDRNGRCFKILPHGKGMRACPADAMPKYGAYRSAKIYRAAVQAAGGHLPNSRQP